MNRNALRKSACLILALLIFFIRFRNQPTLASARTGPGSEISCENPGWFPTGFGLKDHTVFFSEGMVYIMSNYIPGEYQFAYARSADGCQWEDLGPVLSERTPGGPDELAIWAPFVLEENGQFYAYYTGVNSQFTQSIMLASTSNPADPTSWNELGVIFRPNHPGTIWDAGEWADNRDPMVLKVANNYFLYYTGRDLGPEGDFGIIGLATADSPLGPWVDLGAILSLPASSRTISSWSVSSRAPFLLPAMPESPTVYVYQGNYYLFFHDTSQGETYHIGSTPTGPWSEALSFSPGWVHEFWTAGDGSTFTSFLTDYTITISPVIWSPFTTPSRPFIGRQLYPLFIPLAIPGG